MSALLPDRPPLGAWYLVTPGGLSSVKITDGLTFAEEETHQGRQLALVPHRAEEGLIRFRVDESGIWLAVCNSEWQISGAEGVVVRPFPIFRPVDVYFYDSVAHLRPDIDGADCEQAIELSLERVPEPPQIPLSRSSIRQLQNQLNASGQYAVTAADEKPRERPRAVISPLPEPGFRKIGGEGRPSSVRLIPDPAPRDEIPLLTDTLTTSPFEPSSDIPESEQPYQEPVSAEVIVVPEPQEALPAVGTDAMVIEASPDPRRTDRPRGARIAAPQPKRHNFARVVIFAISVLMMSIDLPVYHPLAVNGEEGASTPSRDAGLPSPDSSGTASGAARVEPVGHSDTSGELMAAVEALLESRNPPDPATRQFVEDAIRVLNGSNGSPGDQILLATPGGAASTGMAPAPDTPPQGAEKR